MFDKFGLEKFVLPLNIDPVGMPLCISLQDELVHWIALFCLW